MNMCIKRSLAATYIVIITAILFILGVWPSCVIHRTYSTSSAIGAFDSIAPADEVGSELPDGVSKSHSATEEHQLAQVFVSEGTRLEYVDVYVCNDVSEQMLDFAIYDGEFEQIYHKAFMTDEGTRFPGYIRIPMRLKLERGTPYIFAIYGENEGLRAGLEDHYTTANTSVYPANYDGVEDEDHNLVCGMKFSIALNSWQIAVADAIILLMAVIAIALIRILFGASEEKKITAPLYGSLEDREVRIGRLLQYVSIILAAIALIMVWPVCYWGRETVDIFFSDISILMLAGLLFFLFGTGDDISGPDVKSSDEKATDLKDRVVGCVHSVWPGIHKLLTPVAIGIMLWYCAEYMNGLFDIVHAYMARRVLIWFFIMLITTFKKDEVINIFNGIWLIAGSVIGYLVARPYKGDVELESLYELNGWIILTGGFIIINVIMTLIRLVRKKVSVAKLSLPYAIPFAVFIAGLVILAHTRWWPAYLAVIMGLLIFRSLVWEDRKGWLKYLCDGILVNFFIMLIFSLIHRPYHTYIYHRYNMSYYTVTMTATHLTMSIAAAAVRLFIRYRELSVADASLSDSGDAVTGDRKLFRVLVPDMMLFGAVSCYAIFTLSRTAYAAIIVMITAGLFTVLFIYCKKTQRLRECIKYIAVMLVAVAFMFPVTFSATRMIPAAFDDPVIYAYEPASGTIYPGTHPSDERYMNIRRFIEVFNSKVLSIGDTVTDAGDGPFRFDDGEYYGIGHEKIYLASADDAAVTDSLLQLASASDSSYGEDEPQDATNGRISIFKSYIEQSNLWGHDTMGAILEDGTESAHAHNIYLQVVFDHGWIFGIFFALFMAYSWLVGIIRTYRDSKRSGYMAESADPRDSSSVVSGDCGHYILLVPVLLTGFMTAGMAEWIFHPCNPFGLAVCMAMVSMVFRDR